MLKFKRQIIAESDAIIKKINRAVNNAATGAWQVAVDNTPAPPSSPGASYQRTGRLRAGWKLNTGRNVGLIPAMGKYSPPTRPDLKFDLRLHSNVQIWNNIPYGEFVNDGLGGGNRVAHKMLEKATVYFDTKLNMALKSI